MNKKQFAALNSRHNSNPKRFFRNHHATSPIIAAILIIISLSIIAVFALKLTVNVGTQAGTFIKLENACFYKTDQDYTVILQIRNTGTSNAYIQEIAIMNDENQIFKTEINTQAILPGTTSKIGLTTAFAWTCEPVNKVVLSLSSLTLEPAVRYKVQVTTSTSFIEFGYFYTPATL